MGCVESTELRSLKQTELSRYPLDLGFEHGDSSMVGERRGEERHGSEEVSLPF